MKRSQVTVEYFLFLAVLILIIISVLGKKSAVSDGMTNYVSTIGKCVTSMIPDK